MDFGRVPENELTKINFSLPPDPPATSSILKGEKAEKIQIYIGCPTWRRQEWVGKLYPKGTKEALFLDEYIKHFNSIELNATHYKLYNSNDIKKWVDKAKKHDFTFCPKVYQGISHVGLLNDKKFLTDIFLESIAAFGKHLGAVFLQVSDKFGPHRKEELFQYLSTLPKNMQFFVEVRHPDWFKEPQNTELFEKLKKLNIGAVITDTAGRRDCCHMHLTVPKAFIRYVGNSLHASDYTRIDSWVTRIAQWVENGLEELNFFMHMPDETLSPELTIYFVEQLNKKCGLDLKKPKMITMPKLF